MSTILLAYEFGGGLGHINRLLAVAQRLDPRHKLVFAVPRMATHRPTIESSLTGPIDFVEGVLWVPTSSDFAAAPTHIMADTLHLYGYGERERLLAASLQWMEILARVSPDLIVADMAPTLRLVSQVRIPTVVVGNGYTVPPSGRPMPPIRPWVDAVPARSRSHEGQLFTAANDVRDKRSGPSIDFLADLFHGEKTFVCTIPEFDPYARMRVEPPTWPFNVPRPPQEFPSERQTAVFCYLPNAHPAIKEVLAAVSALDLPSEIYIQGGDPHVISRQCSRKTRIHMKPADLSVVLPQARILLHHGGLGMAFAGLAAGVPQLITAMGLEHQVTARGLTQFKCCRLLRQRAETNVIKRALEEMLADPNLLPAAYDAKEQLEARRVEDPIAEIAATCEAFVTG
jgi:UDP:flavonoid glycosyltransferase YjiC (YdhE family)